MGSSVAGLLGIHCTHCNGTGKAMPPRPIENPKGGGPGTKEVPKGAKYAPVKDNSSPRAGGPEGKPTAADHAGGGRDETSVSSYPDDKDVKHPAIKGAGGGSAKRGAKTATETPEDEIWQPKSTWEHGWGSESTPDDSLSGDDGDEPDELEQKKR